MPIVARKSPTSPPMTPLMTLPLDTLVMMDRPNTASAKYSGLLNCRATFAKRGAMMTRHTVLKIPPKVLAIVEMPRARPGWCSFVARG